MNLSINGQQLQVQGVRALRPGITIEQAVQKTKNNGLDEVFFTSNGQSYVAYGDSLDISKLKKNQIPAVMFASQKADIVAYDDEVNSVWEGVKKGAIEEIKTGMGAVRTAVNNLVSNVGPSIAAAGGIGIAGLGIYQIWRTHNAAVGATMAAQGAIGASAAGSWIGDALKGSLGTGLKVIGVSAGAGLALLSAYGAVRGALEAKNTTKDYGSIAAVTQDGTEPVNGGESLNWNQLYPPGGHQPSTENRSGIIAPGGGPTYGSNPFNGAPSYSPPMYYQPNPNMGVWQQAPQQQPTQQTVQAPAQSAPAVGSIGLMNPNALRAANH